MSSKLVVALCQLPGASLTKHVSLTRATVAIAEAAAKGAKLVLLPESFNCPYSTAYFAEFSEAVAAGNPTYDAMSAAAAQHQVWLVAGSIPEAAADGKLYNTSLTFGPDGCLRNVHRKVHLFSIDTPTVKINEGDVLSAGSTATVVDLDADWKLGVGICFDIRYPQLNWKLSEQGCNLAVFPGAFNMVSGPTHWELLARARAMDGQQYVLVCSPARDTESSYVAWGHSMVVDPIGKVAAALEEKEGILIAELDLAQVHNARQTFPVLRGVRHDLYALKWNATPSP